MKTLMPFTHRTRLSPLAATDADFLADYYRCAQQARYLPTPSVSMQQLAANREAHWRNHGFGTYLVEAGEDLAGCEPGQAIGYCGLERIGDSAYVDLRFALIRSVWGQGLGHEVASACLQLGFSEFGLTKIWGAALPDNLASINLLCAIGMQQDPEFDIYGEEVLGFSVTASAIASGCG